MHELRTMDEEFQSKNLTVYKWTIAFSSADSAMLLEQQSSEKPIPSIGGHIPNKRDHRQTRQPPRPYRHHPHL